MKIKIRGRTYRFLTRIGWFTITGKIDDEADHFLRIIEEA